MAEEFICSNCGGTFEKSWSDEEAEAESVEVFGAPADDPVLVCDDCYQRIMRWGTVTGALDDERDRLIVLTKSDGGEGSDRDSTT